MEHDFNESLKLSQEQADSDIWPKIYNEAFGTQIASIINIRNDGWAQRGGIDRLIVLKSGRIISVDEKVRAKDYPDILLEYLSSEEKKTPGWIEKDLACEYIAYAFIPSKKCYLLPFLSLRKAWFKNRYEWKEKYFHSRAKNNIGNGKHYTTVSVAVPIHILLDSLKDNMEVSWQ